LLANPTHLEGTIMTKFRSKGGRPASYTDAQLEQAIATAESREAEVTWEYVKAVLVDEHGVSPTIS